MKSDTSANAAQLQPSERTSSAEVEHGADNIITIRVVAPPQARGGSPLVALEELGLEREAARKLRDSGELPCVKIGRRWYAKRSDVEAMFDRLAAASSKRSKRSKSVQVLAASSASVLANIAAAERRRGAR